MAKIKRTTIILLIAITFSVSCVPSARADSWGTNMGAAIWKQTTEQMVKSIQDTLLANLKMAALRIVQARLMSLLGGSSGPQVPGVAGFIISDWKMFIYNSAMKYSVQVTNDFFNSVNAGATSAMRQYVTGPAQRAVNVDYWSMRPDLQNYVAGGNPTAIFNPGAASNPWMAWRMAAMPQNDLAFTYLRAASFQQAAYNQESQARIAEGQAGQGYKGKESTSSSNRGSYTAVSSQGGKVTVPPGSNYTGGQQITTPGSTIASLTTQIQNMPVQMLTLARSIPELATAMVNQMITQVIQNGVTNMISGGSAGGGASMTQGMMNSATSQMQGLIQGGVRSVANPTNLFR